MNNEKILKRKTKRLVIWLSFIVLAMFGFGFALVPLYNVLCTTLGINGKTNTSSIKNNLIIDKSRVITVQFLANTNANLNWEFKPVVKTITIHPGQSSKIAYYAKNRTNHTMSVQAVPSVTPGLAAKHLKKTECFCFTQQTLKPHQSMAMPMIFHIDPDLPKNIHTVTLSYTLFKAKNKIGNKKPKGRISE